MADETKTQEQIAAEAAAAAAANKTPEQLAADAAAAAGTKTAEQLAAEALAATEAEITRRATELVKPPDTYALTLPADARLTDADLPSLAAEAKALGLTTAQAQTLVQVRNAELATAVAQDAQRLADLKADPELGGAHYDTTVAHAQSGLDWLIPKDSEEGKFVREQLTATGLGNHKAFVRMFARIGKARAEDRPITGAPPATKTRKRDHEVMYDASTAAGAQ